MKLADQLKGLSAEEIEDRLVHLATFAEKDSDRIKALELLAKIKGIIQHGNKAESKDFTEIMIGSHTTKKEREARDAGGER